jgi:hypothetical protein
VEFGLAKGNCLDYVKYSELPLGISYVLSATNILHLIPFKFSFKSFNEEIIITKLLAYYYDIHFYNILQNVLRFTFNTLAKWLHSLVKRTLYTGDLLNVHILSFSAL